MKKKISNDDRRKMVEKFGQSPVEKKKKLKHPPKPKKEENSVSSDVEDNESFCKKTILPKVKIGQKNLATKGEKKSKKIRIIAPKPIHVGKAVL